MNASKAMALALFAAAPAFAAAAPPEESVRPLIEQALPNTAGKRFTAVVVNFLPGARAVPHRHGSAFLYAYVLAGRIRSQLEGEPVRTYRAGEGWTEQPGVHHLMTENASKTAPARLLVTFISNQGEPLKTSDLDR